MWVSEKPNCLACSSACAGKVLRLWLAMLTPWSTMPFKRLRNQRSILVLA